MKLSAKNYIRNRHVQQKLGLRLLTPEELRELQMLLLDIYQEILRVCEKHSLTILLSGGSTLGAVRHKGFIPWDDDMDLMMLRSDYERFVEVFRRDTQKDYRLKEHGFYLNIIKDGTNYMGLMGAEADDVVGHVDIFPIDFVPENRFSRIWRGLCSDFLIFTINSRDFYLYDNEYLQAMFSQSFQARMIFRLRKMLGCLVSRFDPKTFLRLQRKIVIYSKPSTKTTIACGCKHYFGELLDYSVFFPAVPAAFEGVNSHVPHQVDKYLNNLYGSNFMSLPPEDKREAHSVRIS
ncbi:LicD family protein [Parabacteroides goldsteinii]|uniref:LicD family protein n=1 Tax=Parabacteroides goldsteinii TaxID=328812 RepID=UPI0032C0278D